MFVHDLLGNENLKNVDEWIMALILGLLIVVGILVLAIYKTCDKLFDLLRPLPQVMFPNL